MKYFKQSINIVLGCTISIFILQLCQYFITNTVITKIQDNIDFNDIAIKSTFCLLLVYLVYWLFIKTKDNIVIDRKLFKSITILTIVYSLYRFDIIPHSNWNFVNIFESIKYCDSLYVVFVVYYLILAFKQIKSLTRLCKLVKKLILQLFDKYKYCSNDPYENNIRSSINYSSINYPEEDKLNFYPNVDNLLKRIIEGSEYYKDRAICVGLSAPWGSGKTSYLNLLQFAVEKDTDSVFYNKAIIVKFNPWFSSTPDRMVQDFMSTLSNTLNKYNPNISSELIYYSKILSNAQLGWFSNLIDICFNSKEDAIEKQFSKISECISQINIPIIVFIDDIDRLQPDEVMRVLQLIRNTANFKKTIFIIPYDEDHILNALDYFNIRKGYLDKILTQPHYLPELTKEATNIIFSDIIATKILANSEDKIAIEAFFNDTNINFDIRSLTSFAIEISSSKSHLINLGLGNIYIYDLLLIEYIKYEYNDLYKIIHNEAYTDIKEYTIQAEDNSFTKTKDLNRLIDKDYFENYFIVNTKYDTENELIFNILSLMFSDSKHDTNPYRLKYQDIYETYFGINMNHEFINYNDFYNCTVNNPSLFKAKLNNWKKMNNKNLLLRLLKTCKFTNIDTLPRLWDDYLDVFPDNDINLGESKDPFVTLIGIDYYIKYDDINYNYSYKEAFQDYFKHFQIHSSNKLIRKFNLMVFIYQQPGLRKLYYDYKTNLSIFSTLYRSYLDQYLSISDKFSNDIFNYVYYINVIPNNDHKEEILQIIIDYINNNLKSFVFETSSIDKNGCLKILEPLFSGKKNSWQYQYCLFLKQCSKEFSQQDWFYKHVEKIKGFWPAHFKL